MVRPLRDSFSLVAPTGPHRRHATRACTCTDKLPPPRSTIATSVMGQARELVGVDGQPLSSCNRQRAGKGFRRTPGSERGGARTMRTTEHCSKLETCLRGLAAAAGAFWLASVFAASLVNVDVGVAPELSFSGGLRVRIEAASRVDRPASAQCHQGVYLYRQVTAAALNHCDFSDGAGARASRNVFTARNSISDRQ